MRPRAIQSSEAGRPRNRCRANRPARNQSSAIPWMEARRATTQSRERPAPEITVIGHTDRVGSDEDNDALSRARAETVRKLIEQTGVEATSLEATGRGEREPLVQTADKVAEPRNRRVEISIR